MSCWRGPAARNGPNMHLLRFANFVLCLALFGTVIVDCRLQYLHRHTPMCIPIGFTASCPLTGPPNGPRQLQGRDLGTANRHLRPEGRKKNGTSHLPKAFKASLLRGNPTAKAARAKRKPTLGPTVQTHLKEGSAIGIQFLLQAFGKRLTGPPTHSLMNYLSPGVSHTGRRQAKTSSKQALQLRTITSAEISFRRPISWRHSFWLTACSRISSSCNNQAPAPSPPPARPSHAPCSKCQTP